MEQYYPDYLEYIFIPAATADNFEEAKDILIAELSDAGFESFTDTDEQLSAYIRQEGAEDFTIPVFLQTNVVLKEKNLIKGQNWNQVWESNFEPIEIPGKLYVRANFHAPHPTLTNELVITPKMSFGTGHHSTTRLMLEELLTMDLTGKRVLDMGCGTGILALAAFKQGATDVTAVDNDPQCIINSTENYIENGQAPKQIYLLENMPALSPFDLIIANIQRNVLLEQMHWYTNHLKPGGILLVSGIRPEDKDDLTTAADTNGLKFAYFNGLNDWIMIRFEA